MDYSFFFADFGEDSLMFLVDYLLFLAENTDLEGLLSAGVLDYSFKSLTKECRF